MAEAPGKIPSVKKKKQRKIKMQYLLSGRTRRRINSASNSVPADDQKSFVRSASLSVPASASILVNDENDNEDDQEELDFLEMLGRVQSSRLDDQRTSLPLSLSQSSGIEDSIENISLKAESTKDINMEPIKEVLALGPPYPLVVLPVEGDYWMEGTNHILQRDMHNRPIIPRVDLSKCIVEINETAHAYRESFLGREHLNFAAVDGKYGPLLLSVKCETNAFGDGNYNDSRDYYEIILRLKDKTIHQFLPAGSLSENPRPREIVQGVIQDDLDIERFHPIAVPRISENIVRYDEHVLTSCYKVGIFYQKHGQTTEEEYFGNMMHSRSMSEFLDCIGRKVKLEGFKGYRGGLDVKYNQTGEYSYHTVFRNREFMFHISTLLPFKADDVQQVQRKRHIGNDIVAIVFQDENTPFCPTSIRSHFLHVFIVVQVIDANTPNVRYKVSVTARDGVPNFGPALPNPAVFRKGAEFREFLMTKILNAELAACKSEKFSQLAERTRAMLLQQLVSDLILRNEQLLEETDLNRTFSGGKGSILSSFRSALANSKNRNGSSQSLNSNLAVQSSQNGLSRSLNDITDSGDEGKKEKKKFFSKKSPTRENSRDQERRESKSSAISPASPSYTWPNASQSSLHPERELFLRTKSAENGYQRPYQYSRYFSDNTGSASSSPSLSHHHLHLNLHPEMSHRQNRNLSAERYPRDLRAGSLDEEQIRQMDPRSLNSHYISVSSCSSSYEDISSSSACSALDAAQREIEILRSEISKLKSDKMDLVRQNVVYQREIRKFKEKSLHQTAQLYSVQHELSKLRVSQNPDDPSNQDSSSDHELKFIDIDKTPVSHNMESVSHELKYNSNDNTPVNQNNESAHQELKACQSEMTPVRYNSKYGHRAVRGVPSHFSNKRHSISHV